MIITQFSYYLYDTSLTNKERRRGILLQLINSKGKSGWGEVAPLPKWSLETLEDALDQLKEKENKIKNVNWSLDNCFHEILNLHLFPSVSFGLESALLAILSPISNVLVPVSALLMGSFQEIREQANLRHQEGYTSAKLKIQTLSFKEAAQIVFELKEKFHLRIDVNRSWKTSDSLRFFAQFPLDAFDYVEEPFQDPHDLKEFRHPLAVDESFPSTLSLKQLESLPNLKALIYKPTLQGGLSNCIPLSNWAKERGIKLVLSSSFESDLGLAQVASMAYRLSLPSPVGIGTYHYLKHPICKPTLKFFHSKVSIPSKVSVTAEFRKNRESSF